MSVHWLLIVTALILYLQGKLYQWQGLRGVNYRREFDVSACFQGEEVQLVEVISNRKLLPLPWLRLESLMQSGLHFHSQSNLDISKGELLQNHRSLFSLMPYTQITRRHRVLCLKRGCYDLKSATMTCGDPLGLYTTFRFLQFDRQTRLLVYPERIPLSDIPLPSHSWQGDVTVRRWILDDPFRIAGVRQYQYGDTMNMINWSATARAGSLQVHRRDFTADHRIMIMLNFEITETMWGAVTIPERIEKGIAYAAAIASSCLSQGIDTGFACNGVLIDDPEKRSVRIPPSGGDAHLLDLYESMAMLQIERSEDFSDFLEYDLLEGTKSTDFIVITSYVSEKMERQFDLLRHSGNAVQIVSLTDAPLPSYGEGDGFASPESFAIGRDGDNGSAETKGA
ncbi:DUF58 domain-containing protein [Paenibacillus ginsengarvi]|uniref:DUF58 domain-containing protein n=1 Tax=Paenibacillus ginsengarvi TaxID=400777 RepID=A0A3B0CC98_9BACL|nr:DUF58 domain-containing protein [Paenibacillus ginsengarvi]RKN82221.1 DUF58 domain-containing protein [Paenibacillus ginsengarvi]